MSSISVHLHLSSSSNHSVVLLVALVVVPEEMDVLSSAIEELKVDWLARIDRFCRSLSNFNNSVRIRRFGNEDILAVDGAVVWDTTSCHPWVSSITSHVHSLSCFNVPITH